MNWGGGNGGVWLELLYGQFLCPCFALSVVMGPLVEYVVLSGPFDVGE